FDTRLLRAYTRFCCSPHSSPPTLHSFPTRRSSDLDAVTSVGYLDGGPDVVARSMHLQYASAFHGIACIEKQVQKHLLKPARIPRSEEHTSELQSPDHLVCRLLLEKKKDKYKQNPYY